MTLVQFPLDLSGKCPEDVITFPTPMTPRKRVGWRNQNFPRALINCNFFRGQDCTLITMSVAAVTRCALSLGRTHQQEHPRKEEGYFPDADKRAILSTPGCVSRARAFGTQNRWTSYLKKRGYDETATTSVRHNAQNRHTTRSDSCSY